uniref:Uncharacterized protein n=1 Tax=Anguilla anguilla TaxID=7936 RepID=A0A0E9WPA2_ANGAN
MFPLSVRHNVSLWVEYARSRLYCFFGGFFCFFPLTWVWMCLSPTSTFVIFCCHVCFVSRSLSCFHCTVNRQLGTVVNQSEFIYLCFSPPPLVYKFQEMNSCRPLGIG